MKKKLFLLLTIVPNIYCSNKEPLITEEQHNRDSLGSKKQYTKNNRFSLLSSVYKFFFTKKPFTTKKPSDTDDNKYCKI